MSTEKTQFGLFIIDRSRVTIAILTGDKLNVIESIDSSTRKPLFERCSAMLNVGSRRYGRLIEQGVGLMEQIPCGEGELIEVGDELGGRVFDDPVAVFHP